MRLRTFTGMAGLAVGYYLGSQAGRERYDQINRLLGLDRSVKTAPIGKKARAVADLTFERARGGAQGVLDSVRSRRATPLPDLGD